MIADHQLWLEGQFGQKVGHARHRGPPAMARRPFWAIHRSRGTSRTTRDGSRSIWQKLAARHRGPLAIIRMVWITKTQRPIWAKIGREGIADQGNRILRITMAQRPCWAKVVTMLSWSKGQNHRCCLGQNPPVSTWAYLGASSWGIILGKR